MVDDIVSHYKILAKLGEGGMGVVYKAQDLTLHRIVALKFLPSHLHANDAERKSLLEEARSASALNHPNICAIHSIGEFDDGQFIDLEYIDGRTLGEKINHHPLPLNDALSFAIQIGEALQEAHTSGVVHRDIKADNVMVNSKNQIKVMDFGLAKLKGAAKLTHTSSTAGTLAYMAPEQIQGGAVDARSDIFAFGVLLYEMLTGQMPFRGEHEAATVYSIVNEEPAPIQKYLPDISSELVHVLNRALEKDPDDRYQTVHDMVIDLRRLKKETSKVSRAVPGMKPSDSGAEPFHKPTSDSAGRMSQRFAQLAGAVIVILAVAGLYFFVLRTSPIDSIAVLPFENVGADPNTEYLSDGITESLINTLSQLSHLTVMSRSSVFHYKGKDVDPMKAGKELGVKAVLVGRVTQRGDNLQISTELVDVSNNSHIWGEQYNKTLSDILVVQQDISKEISQQLKVKLVGDDEKKLTKRSTENTEAYQLYLKGKFQWNKRKADDLQKAVDYFNQAVEKDPNFALAYAGLASTYALLPEYSGRPARDYIPKAEKAAKKALELDATLAEPHAVIGMIKYEYQRDWGGADKELKRAIELDPNYPTGHHWYSGCLEERGKLEEALTEIKRAQAFDPLSPVITSNVGEVLFYMQRYDLAREEYNKVLELDPNFPAALVALGDIYAQQNKFGEAISELQKVRQIVGTDDPYGAGHLGYVYAKAGKKDEATKILNQLLVFSKEGYTLSVEIAWVYAGLGNKDKVFEWLEKGYNEQNSQLGYLKIDPMWDDLRSDSRYTSMLKRIGLEK